MRIRIPFVARRSGPLEAVDRYLDGEMTAAERSSFEDSATPGSDLAGSVREHALAKAAVQRLPSELEPPRSFRLTPAMVAAPAQTVPAPRGRPRLQRATQALAGVSAAVMVGALAIGSLGGGASGDDDDEAAFFATSAEVTDAGAADKNAPAGAEATSAAASATAAATVPPVSGGGVSGQTVPTPVPSPQPPATGSTAEPTRDGGEPERASSGEAADSAQPAASIQSYGEVDGGSGIEGPYVVAFGAGVAAVALALVAWTVRRREA